MGGSPGVWAVFLSRVHENYKGERRGNCQVWRTEMAPSSVGWKMLSGCSLGILGSL